MGFRPHSVAAEWGLTLGEPYPPGACATVLRAIDADGRALALKLGRRHFEAEQEADGLAVWDGDGIVRCERWRRFDDVDVLLLERCEPGTALRDRSEPEQDVVIAELLRRLWDHAPAPGGPRFRPLTVLCDAWAQETEQRADRAGDPGLAREGAAALRELARTADRAVLLATDLHAGNVLAAEREPWLAIDPKPFVGDPAFDPVQHMLNCSERLADDPGGLAARMADLLHLDPERVARWLFARCAQESHHDRDARAAALALAL